MRSFDRLRAPSVWPALVLAGVVTLVHAPILLGDVVFSRDPANWNYPARAFLRAAVLAGESVGWNPLQGFGLSTWANPLYGHNYPPNWLFFLVPASGVVHLLTWQSLLHAWWGGLGVIVLLRRFGVRAQAAYLGGVAWSLSGHTTSSWTAGLLLLGGAWVPWIAGGLVALLRTVDEHGPRWRRAVVLAAVPIAMGYLMGEVFVATMGVLFGGALAAIDALTRSSADAGRRALRWAGAGALSMTLALGLACATLLPVERASAGTDRGQALPLDKAEQCSVHPLRLLECFAPLALGHPLGGYPAGAIVGEPALGQRPLSFSLYLGAGAGVLALLALAHGRRLAWGIAGVVLLALLIALGRHTPVHAWWRVVASPFARMRYPEKYFVLVASGWALLVGLGAERFLAESGRLRKRSVAFVFALLASVVVVATVDVPWLEAPFSKAGAIAVVAAAAVLLAGRLLGRGHRVGVLVLAIAVTADLAWPTTQLQDFAPAELARREPRAAQLVKAENPDAPAPVRVYRRRDVDQAVARNVPAGTSAVGQLRSMMTLVYATSVFGIDLVPAYDAAASSTARPVWASIRDHEGLAMRAMGITWAMLPAPDGPAPRPPWLEPVADPLPGARLYRVERPLPRVYVAGQRRVVREEPSPAALLEEDVVEGRVALVRGDRDDSVGSPGRPGSCRLVDYANGRVEAACQLAADATVVFLEQWDAGWRATVDGRQVAIDRVNAVFRGVAVPRGAHSVVMTFHPPGVQAGRLASLATLLVCVALLLWDRVLRAKA